MSAPHLEDLYSLDRLGIKPGLERMAVVMEALGHPEQKFQSVHIAGTNGKGSVAAMIESVLRTAGYRTALYTSPDIYSYHERMRISGAPIPDAELAALIQELRAVCSQAGIQLTFFEFGTALAYLHFSRQNVDIAVIEVGMGGLLDATNVITPVLSVITNVGLDHQEFLGDTKEKITREKAGIIKPGVPCVTGETNAAILGVIKDTCRLSNAPLIQASLYISAEVVESTWERQKVMVGVNGPPSLGLRPGERGELFLPLLGSHQVENLKTALAALAALPAESYGRSMFPRLGWQAIQQGIAATKWEGRLDIVSRRPLIIVDGAHNADGMNALVRFLQALPRRDVLIFGLKQDKQFDEAAQHLAGAFGQVIFSEGSYQPQSAARLVAEMGNVNTIVEPSVAGALQKARQRAGPDGTIVVAGSLYLVADALAVLRGRPRFN